LQGGSERSGLDLYFLSENGQVPFKSTILFRPYFYVVPETDHISEDTQLPILFELLTSQLHRLYEGHGLYRVEIVYKQDLDQLNHLSPSKMRRGRPIFKLIFDTTSQMIEVRNSIREIVLKNKQRGPIDTLETALSFSSSSNEQLKACSHASFMDEPLRYFTDIREYDVPYVVRVCTELNIRAGTWYTVQLESQLSIEDSGSDFLNGSQGVLLLDPDHESKASPTFFAFDIECTKAPLKFPSAEVDEIFMISYMVSTPSGPQGFLIVSRSVVSADVQDFEYTPKPNYPGPFHIYNEANEKDLLRRFFTDFRRLGPQIVVTYNGDFFDFPYIDARAKLHGMSLFQEIGIEQIGEGSNATYRGRLTVHLDAFHWVQRDSYLPQGAQGLKAVTKYKLGYDPVEVDPEDMVRFAQEKPIHMATYSVSDAVATYYLYEKYVHLFIFSLCTIIPMGPEDVLGKGSGTLCEALLMVQASQKNIVCPNKHTDDITKFHKGHLLESETYIGGKVECLETGVYRSDLEYEFELQPSAFQQLIDSIDRDLTFTIEVENGKHLSDVANYVEVSSSFPLYRPRRAHESSNSNKFLFTFSGTTSYFAPFRRTSRPTEKSRETLHLPFRCWCHVSQYYFNKPAAAECHSE
jgi:DNA polymerase epsilon subunit 1